VFHRAARTIGLAAALVSLLCIGQPAQATHKKVVAPHGSLAGPRAALTGAGYYYAQGAEALAGTNTVAGISANLYIGNPYMQCNTGEHTLVEEALKDANGHAVELGWVKDSCSGPPKLFASYWNNGWAGCYYEGCGWVDVTPGNSADDLGRDLSSVASATFPGNVKKFLIQYSSSFSCGASSSGWFFYYDNLGVGCLPSGLFTGGFATAKTTFAYGEVYYAGSTVPCSDMVNGKQGSSAVLPLDASDPGYIGSVAYVAPSPSTLTPTLTLSQTDSNAYTAFALGSTGNRTFTLGGPGYNSTGGTPGNTGSC
jgi:hypothetical protein